MRTAAAKNTRDQTLKKAKAACAKLYLTPRPATTQPATSVSPPSPHDPEPTPPMLQLELGSSIARAAHDRTQHAGVCLLARACHRERLVSTTTTYAASIRAATTAASAAIGSDRRSGVSFDGARDIAASTTAEPPPPPPHRLTDGSSHSLPRRRDARGRHPGPDAIAARRSASTPSPKTATRRATPEAQTTAQPATATGFDPSASEARHRLVSHVSPP